MGSSEQTALSRGDSPEYGREVIRFLENRDPFDVFEQTPGELDAVTKGLSDEQLRAPEKLGKWSVLEVVWHLADVELVLGLRYRKVVAESGCTVPAINQDAWVKELRYNERTLADGLDQYRTIRTVNLALLRTLPDDCFDRFAIHEQRGKETLRDMIRLYAAHDRYHLYQIDRIKNAVGAA